MSTFYAEKFSTPCPLCGQVPADGDKVRRFDGRWCHVDCVNAEALLDELHAQEMRMARAADLDAEARFR